MRAFPPRLPEQPVSLSRALGGVRDQDCARLECAGLRRGLRHAVPGVTGFSEPLCAASRRRVRASRILIPAEDLLAFNDAIVGLIEVIAEFRQAGAGGPEQGFQ